jgi:hypothetical protein
MRLEIKYPSDFKSKKCHGVSDLATGHPASTGTIVWDSGWLGLRIWKKHNLGNDQGKDFCKTWPDIEISWLEHSSKLVDLALLVSRLKWNYKKQPGKLRVMPYPMRTPHSLIFQCTLCLTPCNIHSLTPNGAVSLGGAIAGMAAPIPAACSPMASVQLFWHCRD